MSKLVFESAVNRDAGKAVPFDLDGATYHFTAPKRLGMFLSAHQDNSDKQIVAQLEWLDAGLPEEEAAVLRKRMRDPNDTLDVVVLLEIVGALMEATAGRPTTPSPDS
jgi:hypothetical protein